MQISLILNILLQITYMIFICKFSNFASENVIKLFHRTFQCNFALQDIRSWEGNTFRKAIPITSSSSSEAAS